MYIWMNDIYFTGTSQEYGFQIDSTLRYVNGILFTSIYVYIYIYTLNLFLHMNALTHAHTYTHIQMYAYLYGHLE
jgi:hypothetical protein